MTLVTLCLENRTGVWLYDKPLYAGAQERERAEGGRGMKREKCVILKTLIEYISLFSEPGDKRLTVVRVL